MEENNDLVIEIASTEPEPDINPNVRFTEKDVNYYMKDRLDGILWNNTKKNSFTESFIDILKTIQITGRSKLILKERFISLYEYYKNKKITVNTIYNTCRIITTVFGIVVPALITLDNEISDKSRESLIIGYTTFSMSLLITIINSLIDLFQINKKSYTYNVVSENLETEGWLFLTLTGKYHNYTDHSECWRKFLYKVEKLNIQAINSNIISSELGENLEASKIKIPLNLDNETETSDNSVKDIIYVSN